ncbi:MAG: H+-translocating transhydrogenase subunit alpha [Thermoleophilaceae bacterium]|jgi:NAD(P) transhydrogenase subunit alpha|nr:H+-translocating transhydrogenase subunit alpha [Thermoleophilaceae bacterium]MEA2368730.1 H+-translocating transhydrogenase subunit alpha [Thermoleophilaceae bacterium]MEA2387890.1 H+-translocating transhydrogenase subunit alpha [Thermoleophilaceae bacterium]
MRVGVPNQSAAGETRVAITPDVVRRLANRKVDVLLESGAGAGAHLSDAAFQEAGASVGSAEDAWGSEIVAVVRAPAADAIGRLSRGAVVIGFLNPLVDADTARALASAGATSFAMEAIPRITRAQSMDALSSQATVAGYRAVLLAAEGLDRFFPMLTTAAGTIKPATVLVLGAGVAGLQAIATARRLGAVVTGYDVRDAVREQVESLGARFLQLQLEADAEGSGGYAKELAEEQQRRQQEAMAEAIGRFDVVITTAAVPGRRAPLLVTAAAVEGMKPGSVIVDLAAATGGNCELTEPGETVERHDVKILGPLDLASEMPEHASQLYARNVQSLLELLISDEGALNLNWEDEILAGACITRDGEIVHEGAKQAAGTAAAS